MQSKCKSRNVGCIIVKDDVLIGEGWNSAPVGSNCDQCTRCNGSYKSGENLESAICTHAEANAIGNCTKRGISTLGAVLYCTHFCCKYCASLIIAAGIKEVVWIKEYHNMNEVIDILNRAGVVIRKLEI